MVTGGVIVEEDTVTFVLGSSGGEIFEAEVNFSNLNITNSKQ